MDSYLTSVGKFEFDFKIKARRYDDMMNLKMDLHIHTPASKCYLEEDNDETYYNILKQAVAEKIDIIAITDHNTIDGYKNFRNYIVFILLWHGLNQVFLFGICKDSNSVCKLHETRRGDRKSC